MITLPCAVRTFAPGSRDRNWRVDCRPTRHLHWNLARHSPATLAPWSHGPRVCPHGISRLTNRTSTAIRPVAGSSGSSPITRATALANDAVISVRGPAQKPLGAAVIVSVQEALTPVRRSESANSSAGGAPKRDEMRSGTATALREGESHCSGISPFAEGVVVEISRGGEARQRPCAFSRRKTNGGPDSEKRPRRASAGAPANAVLASAWGYISAIGPPTLSRTSPLHVPAYVSVRGDCASCYR